VELGKPVALFVPKIVGGSAGFVTDKHQYAVARDGQRFLINVTTDEGSGAPITVVLNWTPKK